MPVFREKTMSAMTMTGEYGVEQTRRLNNQPAGRERPSPSRPRTKMANHRPLPAGVPFGEKLQPSSAPPCRRYSACWCCSASGTLPPTGRQHSRPGPGLGCRRGAVRRSVLPQRPERPGHRLERAVLAAARRHRLRLRGAGRHSARLHPRPASAFLSAMVNPIISLLRPVSPLAWLPIGLLVFKKADPAATYTIFICSIWPMIMNTAQGVQRVPQDYLNVARVLALSEWKIVTKILFPGRAAHMLTGIRLSIGTAWLVIVAAEMLTGGVGIGFWVWDEWNNLKVEHIIIAIFVIGIVGLILEQALILLAETDQRIVVREPHHGKVRPDRACRPDFRHQKGGSSPCATSTSTSPREFIALIGHSGLRQIDPAQPDRRPDPADRPACCSRRPRNRRPRPGRTRVVSEPQPAALADLLREHLPGGRAGVQRQGRQGQAERPARRRPSNWSAWPCRAQVPA